MSSKSSVTAKEMDNYEQPSCIGSYHDTGSTLVETNVLAQSLHFAAITHSLYNNYHTQPHMVFQLFI